VDALREKYDIVADPLFFRFLPDTFDAGESLVDALKEKYDMVADFATRPAI
jgi:hypothetical protein